MTNTAAHAITTTGPRSWAPSAPVSVGARVSFRHPVSDAGFVDAAWWPRSRDLPLELGDLLALLSDADRPIFRVSYNPGAWQAGIPRRASLGGRSVRLSGFVEQDPLLLLLANDWRDRRIDVLVIDPGTEPDAAARALLNQAIDALG